MAFKEGVPTVTIQLGGKSRLLGWNWAVKNGLRKHIKADGEDPGAVSVIVDYLPAVVWFAMAPEDRGNLTVSDVEELLHPRNEVEITNEIAKLFHESEPPPSDTAGNETPAAVTKPTAGKKLKSSGQSESMTSV